MIDKDCNRQVLGCLIKKPQYLSEIDKYNLSILDFSTRFERYIFSAITGLYNDGARNIAAIDIENYLSTNVVASETFKLMNGIEYVNDAIALAEVENFPYYYKKLKKLNLLTDLNKSTFFKSSNFYEEDLLAPNAIEINKKFETLEISDIIADYRKALINLETKYNVNKEVVTVKVADGIREFYENIGAEPNVGLALPGKIYSEIMKGARPGKLVIRSGESGLGKTINALIDACTLAYPYRYDNELKEWVLSGHSEKVLFIATEQEPREIYPKILAYLTGIETDRFDYGYFSSFEEHLIKTAIQIIEKYSDNLVIVRIPNPSIELVKLMVRETCLINDIHYVFYDYIFVSSNLIAEFRGSNLRNDELLLLMATALKDLATELQLFLSTSTQVNGKDSGNEIRNESHLAGGRSTINKADYGFIMARPTVEELDILHEITSINGEPNLVIDVYKVRDGKWTQVRIWSLMDLGRLTRKDLFITDARLNPISNFYSGYEYVVCNWTEEEEQRIMKEMNYLNELSRNYREPY